MRLLIPMIVVAAALLACAVVLPPGGAWSSLRVIWPGQAVTMDYSATRLNVRVDSMGIVQSLSCG